MVNAITATQRMREIEEGVERTETRALDDAENIYKKIEPLKSSDEILGLFGHRLYTKIVHHCFFVYQEIMRNNEKGYQQWSKMGYVHKL